MHYTKVKICGLTNLADVRAAVEAGADALGFIFAERSPRFIGVPEAAELIRALPPFVAKVGVFVNASEDQIRQTIAACGLDTVQLHGDETPEFCQRFAVKTIKAFRIRDSASLASLSAYGTSALLLDTYAPHQSGGTGSRFDWNLAVEAKKLGRPIILAGGLTPDNVAAAVQQVHPYAVDVSSGVELSPGRKDTQKIRHFIAAVRRAADRRA